MDFEEVGCDGIDWINLVQDRNGKGGEFLDWLRAG